MFEGNDRGSKEQIVEGMTVRGAEGERLGKVLDIVGDALQIEDGLLFPRDFLVSMDEIAAIVDGEIRLRSGREALRSSDAPFGPERPPEDHESMVSAMTGAEALPASALQGRQSADEGRFAAAPEVEIVEIEEFDILEEDDALGAPGYGDRERASAAGEIYTATPASDDARGAGQVPSLDEPHKRRR